MDPEVRAKFNEEGREKKRKEKIKTHFRPLRERNMRNKQRNQ